MTHLQYFYEISKIPRPSGKEEKIADYLCEFAEKHGLEYYRDENRNVLINKQPSEGYENAPSFCIQGHTDMVCEKDIDSDHDFSKDPIDVYEENGMLKAHGTTLGADNGAAVAIMLALLSEDHKTPYLQCLFTAEEETGLCGASSFDYSKITADFMINIDGEEEDEILTSCAGGLRVKLENKYPTEEKDECVKITVGGLAGGHSGADIDKNRTNASLVMFELISRLCKKGARLCFFEGGSKDNAITPYAVATVACDAGLVNEESKKLKEELLPALCDEDKSIYINIEKTNGGSCISNEDTESVCSLVSKLKTGIIKMSSSVEGFVSTSANMGVVKIENGAVELCLSVRSEDDEERNSVWEEYARVSKTYGYSSEKGQEYPGWKFKESSRLRGLYADAYKTVTGKDIKITAIHAGLECGIISGALPSLDIIAIGPQMNYVHTTAEFMEIESFNRVFKTVSLCLERSKDI